MDILTFKDLVFDDAGSATVDFGNGRGVYVAESNDWRGKDNKPVFYDLAVITAGGLGDVAKGLSPNDVSTKMVELQTAPMEFEPGHRYYISTVADKLTRFVKADDGSEPPCREAIKHASYTVDVVMTTPANEGTWAWQPTSKPHIALYKGRQYLLCRLPKGKTGFPAKSEFHNPLTGMVYPKHQMQKWLPEKGAFGSYLTLPIGTIKSAEDITPEGNVWYDKPAEAVTA